MSYRVYAMDGLESSACTFYRVRQPLTLMDQMGLPVEIIIDDGRMNVPAQYRASMFMEADISFLYQNISEHYHKMMEATKSFKAKQDATTGETRWPPTFIADTDDDLFNIMPLNIAFGKLGTRRHDGTPLEDGEEIWIGHPTEVADDNAADVLFGLEKYPIPGTKATHPNGTRFVYDSDGKWHRRISLWRDGPPDRNIDVAANRRTLENWKSTVKNANLVTCSTPRSAEYIKRECGEDIPTYVSYNSINFDDYSTIDLNEHPGEVRILWEGGSSHQEGLWPLNGAMANVAKKYPHVKWLFWGAPYKWATKNLPNSELISWVPYDAYKLRLSTIGHDISLAPLAPTTFNRSRSAIRWYESSAIWRPAATLAQNFGPYADEIQDGETGLLFNTPDEFEEKLSALIEQETLRKTLASNAKDWVRTNRDARKITMALYLKWSEAREAHKMTMPKEIELAVTVT